MAINYKKFNSGKLFLGILFSLAMLFFAFPTHAALIFGKSGNGTSVATNGYGTSWTTIYKLGQPSNATVSGNRNAYFQVNIPTFSSCTNSQTGSGVYFFLRGFSNSNYTGYDAAQDGRNITFYSGGTQSGNLSAFGSDYNASEYYALYVLCDTGGYVTLNSDSGSYDVSALPQFSSYPHEVEWTGDPQLCITTDSTYSDCPTPAAYTPIISFQFPTSTTTTAPFSTWKIRIDNLQAQSYPQYLSVHWARSTSTLLSPQIPYVFGTDSIFLTPNSTSSSNVIQFIPSSLPIQAITTSTWYAYAEISPSPGPTIASSSIITFDVANTMTPIDTDTSQGLLTPYPTSSPLCLAPAGLTDVGGGISYGLCSVSGLFFGSQQGSFNFLTTQWNGFKTIFPFNIVFNLASTTQTALADASSSTTNYDLYFSMPITGAKVPILTSSTLASTIGATSTAYVFNVEKNLAWVGAAGMILFIILTP